MATKTISIDVEAYRRLKNAKKEGESFSQVIKRVVPKPFDYQKWIKEIEATPGDDQMLDELDAMIAERRAPVGRKRAHGAA